MPSPFRVKISRCSSGSLRVYKHMFFYKMAAAGAQKHDTGTSTGNRSYEMIRHISDYKDAFGGLNDIVDGKVVFIQSKKVNYKYFEQNKDNIPLLENILLRNNNAYKPSLSWDYMFKVDVNKNPAVLHEKEPDKEWVKRVKNIYVKLFNDTCDVIDKDMSVGDKQNKKMQAKLRYDLMMTNFHDLRYTNDVDDQDAGFGDQDYDHDIYKDIKTILEKHNIAPTDYRDFFEGFLKAHGDSAVANLTNTMGQVTITQGGGDDSDDSGDGGGGGSGGGGDAAPSDGAASKEGLHSYLKQLRL